MLYQNILKKNIRLTIMAFLKLRVYRKINLGMPKYDLIINIIDLKAQLDYRLKQNLQLIRYFCVKRQLEKSV